MTVGGKVDWRQRLADGWQTFEPDTLPSPNGPPRSRPIWSLTTAWNEQDVIYALVAHLRQQGVDRIIVLDDSSDDGTRREALAAGAEVRTISTGAHYSEVKRSSIIQSVVRHESASLGQELWWHVADADEFATCASGQTIRDLVDRLPESIDVVGADVLDHVPQGPAGYTPRTDPIPSFPFARRVQDPYCPRGHWKHPLFRVRRAGDITSSPGQHIVLTADNRPAVESGDALLMHHFPIRNRKTTESRLKRLLGPNGRYAESPEDWQRWHGNQRLSSLEAIYAKRYDEVDPNFTPGDELGTFTVRPWRELIG